MRRLARDVARTALGVEAGTPGARVEGFEHQLRRRRAAAQRELHRVAQRPWGALPRGAGEGAVEPRAVVDGSEGRVGGVAGRRVVLHLDRTGEAQRRRALVEAIEPHVAERHAQRAARSIDATAGVHGAGRAAHVAGQLQPRAFDLPGRASAGGVQVNGREWQPVLVPAAGQGVGGLHLHDERLLAVELDGDAAAQLGGRCGRRKRREQPRQVDGGKARIELRHRQRRKRRDPRGRVQALRLHRERRVHAEAGQRAGGLRVERHVACPVRQQRVVSERNAAQAHARLQGQRRSGFQLGPALEPQTAPAQRQRFHAVAGAELDAGLHVVDRRGQARQLQPRDGEVVDAGGERHPQRRRRCCRGRRLARLGRTHGKACGRDAARLDVDERRRESPIDKLQAGDAQLV